MSTSAKAAQDGKVGEDAATREARARAVAMQHALSIEEKKKLQNRVLDMIVLLFDLPSEETIDPAHPAPSDAQLFRECLAIFRPSDLDEAVQERNIDNRCGYAMCRRPNIKIGASTKWDQKLGKFVDKADNRSWCSLECKKLNTFVRSQLSLEPAWLRQQIPDHIKLLSDATTTTSAAAAAAACEENLSTQFDALQLRQKKDAEEETQETLALERGEPNTRVGGEIFILEKEVTRPAEAPKYIPTIAVNDILEGLPVSLIGRKKES